MKRTPFCSSQEIIPGDQSPQNSYADRHVTEHAPGQCLWCFCMLGNGIGSSSDWRLQRARSSRTHALYRHRSGQTDAPAQRSQSQLDRLTRQCSRLWVQQESHKPYFHQAATAWQEMAKRASAWAHMLMCSEACLGQVDILGSIGHLEEGCRAVGDNAVTLHLPKAQATVPGTPLDRLSGQDLHRKRTRWQQCPG